MGQVAVFERSVTTPRHGRGHGPKVAVLARHRTENKSISKGGTNIRKGVKKTKQICGTIPNKCLFLSYNFAEHVYIRCYIIWKFQVQLYPGGKVHFYKISR